MSVQPDIAQGMDTHMHWTLDEVHGCPGRDGRERGKFTKGPMLLGLQGVDKLAPIPKLTLPSSSLSSLCSCLSSPQMEDHRFPAGRNGLTQASFTYQVPAGWGSPCGFFLPCPQVRTPLVLKAPCHTCPIFLGGSDPAVDGIQRTPVPYTAPFPRRCSGVLQTPPP
nr:LOW QUALITY PROTEIN: uncharacterized protein C10orf55 homolog [Equus caballus]